MSTHSRSPEANRARQQRMKMLLNRHRIEAGATVACGQPGCDMTYFNVRQRTTHLLRVHRIDVRIESGPRRKATSQSRNGFERVQKIAVRGRNADSAGFFKRYGYALFGDRRAAA